MAATAIELETTLAYAKGGYSVQAHLGSRAQPAQLVLDTGSSSLAVRPAAYDPGQDEALAATRWVQRIHYGGGRWTGPVLRTRLAFGDGRHRRQVDDALLALVESDGDVLRDADGILGLAYRGLNPAYDIGPLLAGRGVRDPLSWPWPFADEQAADPAAFDALVTAQPGLHLPPAFTTLEEEGVLRDLFALQVPRAVVHVADDRASLRQLAGDPLNRGRLVLGGGPEHQSLYHGGFQSIRLLHDLYYNAHLVGLRLGDGPLLPAPALPPEQAAHTSNAILDTGSSFLVLEATLYAALMAALAAHDPALPELVQRFEHAFQQELGLPNHALDLARWPDLHLHLAAPGGGETVVRVAPGHYWQRNALQHGQSLFLLMPQLPHWPRQSILGLPMFSGRYAVFDRRSGDCGEVRLAAARGLDG